MISKQYDEDRTRCCNVYCFRYTTGLHAWPCISQDSTEPLLWPGLALARFQLADLSLSLSVCELPTCQPAAVRE